MQKREMDSQPPSPSPDSFFVNKVMHWNISVHTHQSLCAAATEDLMTLGLSLVTASLIHKRKRTNRLYVIYILDCIRLILHVPSFFFFQFHPQYTLSQLLTVHLTLLNWICSPSSASQIAAIQCWYQPSAHPCTHVHSTFYQSPPPSLATNYAPFWAELRVLNDFCALGVFNFCLLRKIKVLAERLNDNLPFRVLLKEWLIQ